MADLERPAPDEEPPKPPQKSVIDPERDGLIRNIDPADFRIGSREMFIQATEQTRMALCISDPQLPDCPIVFANQAFVDLTGYALDEIIGRNCRFLQGEGTDAEAVERLRSAVAEERYIVVDLLNYRKDGSEFWNAVHVGPVYDDDGSLAYFFGSQWDITELLSEREKALSQERISRELQHRTDNLFAVINAMIRMSSRTETDVQAFAGKVSDRITALARAHHASIPAAQGDDGTDLAELIETVLEPYRNRFAERVKIGGEAIVLSPRCVTALGLSLHELATNALKYGALSVSEGRVEVDWKVESDAVLLHWKEMRGPAVEGSEHVDGQPGSGSGQMLIDAMLRSLGGTIRTDFGKQGFSALLNLPLGKEISRG